MLRMFSAQPCSHNCDGLVYMCIIVDSVAGTKSNLVKDKEVLAKTVQRTR